MKFLPCLPVVLIFCLQPLFVAVGEDLLHDDFSSYETGEVCHAYPSSTLGEWVFAPLIDSEGTLTAAVDEEGNPVFELRQPLPEGGRGNWHLFRKFDSAIALDSGGQVELQIRIKLTNFDQPFDFVFGLISPEFNPASHMDGYLSFLRFYVAPEADIFQFRYQSDGGDSTEANYITSTSFSVLPNEWYTVDALYDLSKKTYSFRVANDQGEPLAQASDIPFRKDLFDVGGVGFKNRTTNPNRGAHFDLDRVVVRYLPAE